MSDALPLLLFRLLHVSLPEPPTVQPLPPGLLFYTKWKAVLREIGY